MDCNVVEVERLLVLEVGVVHRLGYLLCWLRYRRNVTCFRIHFDDRDCLSLRFKGG